MVHLGENGFQVKMNSMDEEVCVMCKSFSAGELLSRRRIQCGEGFEVEVPVVTAFI